MRATITDAAGFDALTAWVAACGQRDHQPSDDLADRGSGDVSGSLPGASLSRTVRATAVRYTLQRLGELAPGKSVEVRVPPFGAIQCVEGPGHTRGTPPNVVEMDADTWLGLATGLLGWEAARQDGKIHASGMRADLQALVPVLTESELERLG